MSGHKTTLLGAVYDRIEAVMWAGLATGVAAFAVFVLPGIPGAQQRSEVERLADIEHRYDFYCTRWGMPAGTARHAQCITDLQQFRQSIEQQVADDESF